MPWRRTRPSIQHMAPGICRPRDMSSLSAAGRSTFPPALTVCGQHGRTVKNVVLGPCMRTKSLCATLRKTSRPGAGALLGQAGVDDLLSAFLKCELAHVPSKRNSAKRHYGTPAAAVGADGRLAPTQAPLEMSNNFSNGQKWLFANSHSAKLRAAPQHPNCCRGVTAGCCHEQVLLAAGRRAARFLAGWEGRLPRYASHDLPGVRRSSRRAPACQASREEFPRSGKCAWREVRGPAQALPLHWWDARGRHRLATGRGRPCCSPHSARRSIHIRRANVYRPARGTAFGRECGEFEDTFVVAASVWRRPVATPAGRAFAAVA